MKYRESGMPEQGYWEALFDIDRILDAFAIGPQTGAVAELGCGYGTFTIPVATRTQAAVYAFDIDREMVESTRQRAVDQSLPGISVERRDVFNDGFGLPEGSCGACLLFNILHGEFPVAMLQEARRVVRQGGTVAVIHWRRDIPTPRGPSLDIRPSAEHVVAWGADVNGLALASTPFLLPPWHFGVAFTKRVAERQGATPAVRSAG
jgi:SAM-dependent methyltransferase